MGERFFFFFFFFSLSFLNLSLASFWTSGVQKVFAITIAFLCGGIFRFSLGDCLVQKAAVPTLVG